MKLRNYVSIILGVVFAVLWIFVIPVIASVILREFTAEKTTTEGKITGVLLEWNIDSEMNTRGYILLRKDPFEENFGDIEGFDIIESERTISFQNLPKMRAINQAGIEKILTNISISDEAFHYQGDINSIESVAITRSYAFTDTEVINQTDFINNLTYVYKLQEVDINQQVIDLATVIINPPTPTGTPIPSANIQSTSKTSSTSLNESDSRIMPFPMQQVTTQAGTPGATYAPTTEEPAPNDLGNTTQSVGEVGVQGIVSPTLIPIPSITFENDETTEAAITLGYDSNDPIEQDTDYESGWLSAKSILVLGFIGIIWFILGAWFILSFLKIG